ncbi:MAG: hypothetical protein IT307_04175 [Chloroflexi bacterium]|nr:hypothetical protein [Chloroflexota bacterium]
MDLENQEAVKRIVDEQGAENLVVVLGALETESLELLAETMTVGDPSYAGPLAGVPLGLPVYHILEPTVRAAIPGDLLDEKLGVLAFEDGEPFEQALQRTRSGGQA